MRTALLAAALLFATPLLAAGPDAGAADSSHCTAALKDVAIADVTVKGDFKACIAALLEVSKKKCGADLELKLTVTGTEKGKPADLRVLHLDCPGDGGKLSRPPVPDQAKGKPRP